MSNTLHPYGKHEATKVNFGDQFGDQPGLIVHPENVEAEHRAATAHLLGVIAIAETGLSTVDLEKLLTLEETVRGFEQS